MRTLRGRLDITFLSDKQRHARELTHVNQLAHGSWQLSSEAT